MRRLIRQENADARADVAGGLRCHLGHQRHGDPTTKEKWGIPPRVWTEIAIHLHHRIQLDLPTLQSAAVEAPAAPFSRVHEVRSTNLAVETLSS
jgi:hypothetical protein